MTFRKRKSVTIQLFLVHIIFFAIAKIQTTFSQPVNVQATENSTVVLPCAFSKHLGKNRVIWTDQYSTILTFAELRVAQDTRFSISRPYANEWNLQIRSVKIEDEGQYSCQINTSPIQKKSITLTVTKPAKFLENGSSPYVDIKEGEDLRLTCTATGRPRPAVTWKYHRTNETTGEESQTEIGQDEILLISNITRDMSGDYSCQASNGVGKAINRVFGVSVLFPPEVSTPVKRIRQALGKSTVLECIVAAYPQAIVMWMRDDIMISESSTYKIRVKGHGHYEIYADLMILNIREDDYGKYVCQSRNVLGTDHSSVVLEEYILPSTTTAKESTDLLSSTGENLPTTLIVTSGNGKDGTKSKGEDQHHGQKDGTENSGQNISGYSPYPILICRFSIPIILIIVRLLL